MINDKQPVVRPRDSRMITGADGLGPHKQGQLSALTG